MRTRSHKVWGHYKGFDVDGEVIPDDYEGDPSVPGGTHLLSPYIEDTSIRTPDGEEHYMDLMPEFVRDVEDYLLSLWREGGFDE